MDGVDQLVDGRQAILFCDIGDMGIPSRCIGTGVAEKGLDMTKA